MRKGPTYSTKMTRSGVRICDIFDEEQFEAKFRRIAHGYQKRFGDLLKDYNPEDEIAKFKVSSGLFSKSYGRPAY